MKSGDDFAQTISKQAKVTHSHHYAKTGENIPLCTYWHLQQPCILKSSSELVRALAYCVHYSTITETPNLHFIDRFQFAWLTSSISGFETKSTNTGRMSLAGTVRARFLKCCNYAV